MSFQAYLDNIEINTGKSPNEFIALAKQKGFTPETKAGEIAFRWFEKPLINSVTFYFFG